MPAAALLPGHAPIAALIVLLALMIVADLRSGVIPDWINALIAACGLARAALASPGAAMLAREAAAACGTTVLLLATVLVTRRIVGRITIGGGDLKFLIAASLWVGISGTLAVLFAASVAVLAVAVVRARPSLGQRTPFAPMLAGGLILVLWQTGSQSGVPG